MKTATECPVTAPLSVETSGADIAGKLQSLASRDDGWPLREARVAMRLTQADLAYWAGCSTTLVSNVERGRQLPSIDLAERLAAELGVTASDLFGQPNVCACGCGELTLSTYRESHYRSGPAATKEHQDALTKYKRSAGLLDADQLAKLVPCAHHTPAKLAPLLEAEGLAERYEGPWAGNRPWLYKVCAATRLRELFVERREKGRARTTAAMKKWWADRRACGDLGGTVARRGELRSCPCGCGRVRYLRPGEGGKPGHWSQSCHNRDKWARGLSPASELVATFSPRARQRWRGRWGGRKQPGPGARPRGRPRGYTDEQKRRVLELRGLHPSPDGHNGRPLSLRAIARVVDLSKRQVEGIVAAYEVSRKPS
jgi:transcriptional regulator with XRE-family HTH domain